ncbi:MAG: hypothetical protein M3P06_00260 [Acidobacteriota bacterium]|nr:hypothetical protein [Acidobacteriota bacterium]
MVLPLGSFPKEVDLLRNLKLGQGVFLRELTYLVGQADLLAQFDVGDELTRILQTPYPTNESNAHVLNYIFSVPCHHIGNIDNFTQPFMRFTMHLRVRRMFYAQAKARDEQYIIGYVRDRLISAGCVAEVHMGLGWADFIVDGAFDPANLRAFTQFLVDIHEGCVVGPGENDRRSVFARTMTLLGYRWPNDPSTFEPPALPEAKPVIFVRSEPGNISEAIDLTSRRHDNDAVEVRLIDGKSDFVVFAREPVTDVLKHNLELMYRAGKPTTTGGAPHRIQKLETHLVFLEPGEVDRSQTTVFETNDTFPERCGCVNNAHGPGPAISDWIPAELRQSIVNALFLFKSTASDEMCCCDMSQAIPSAQIALTRLSGILDVQHTAREKLDADLASGKSDPNHLIASIRRNHLQIERRVYELSLWHLFSERVLRQRTVASFEEMLMQNDRNVVYRGSVQKFLFLADALMNDFATSVNGGWVPPLFCTMYDSVPKIMSMPSMGIVRIPARHLFALPLVVPDLWHEVGVYWFYKRVARIVFDTRGPDGRTRETTDAEYLTLGDRFADLVVYHHGFGGEWHRFVISLTGAWFDSNDPDQMSPHVYGEEFAALLARLVFALDVSNRWDDIFGLGKGPFSQPEIDTLVRLTYAHVQNTFTHRRVPALTWVQLEYAIGLVLMESRRFGDKLAQQYRKWVSHDIVDPAVRHRFAQIVRRESGRILEFDFDDNLNALFGELYWDSQPGRAQTIPPERFRRMMTVARSGTIEYHRRQAGSGAWRR